jgi:hypothetical protein
VFVHDGQTWGLAPPAERAPLGRHASQRGVGGSAASPQTPQPLTRRGFARRGSGEGGRNGVRMRAGESTRTPHAPRCDLVRGVEQRVIRSRIRWRDGLAGIVHGGRRREHECRRRRESRRSGGRRRRRCVFQRVPGRLRSRPGRCREGERTAAPGVRRNRIRDATDLQAPDGRLHRPMRGGELRRRMRGAPRARLRHAVHGER